MILTEALLTLLVYIISIITHEIGHYVMMWKNGILPTVKINWWYIQVGVDGEVLSLPIRDSYLVYLMGPTVGYFTIVLFMMTGVIPVDWPIWVGYTAACLMDFANIAGLVMLPKADWKSDEPSINIFERNLRQSRKKLEEKGLL